MIAIYTTFLRPKLVKETLPTYLKFFDGKILVLDQGREEDNIKSLCKDNKIIYYKLPFDCGLSYARNFGITKVKELGEDYFLLTADSIKLTETLLLYNVIDFLNSNEKNAVVGLELKNRIFWNLNITQNNGWYFDLPNQEPILHKKIIFQKCDVVKNFFVGKTNVFIQVPWDNKLKLSEHEDEFWRLKIAGYYTFFTNSYSAIYVKFKSSEYNTYRRKNFSNFTNKVKEKYGFSGSYFQYSKTVQKKFQEWRKNNL